jgi:uncharacterized cupin superfamily protein
MIHTLAIAMLMLGQTKIPPQADETALIQVMLHPERYVGVTFTICGALRISDYYNYSYTNLRDNVYSLDFRELNKDLVPSGDQAQLYLSKGFGDPIIDVFTENREKIAQTQKFMLVRAKVCLLSTVYEKDKRGDMLQLLDVQFWDKESKKWKPWTVLEAQKKAKAKAEAEAKVQAEAQAKAQAEAQRQDAIERAKAKKDREAIEAAKWRQWTDASGKHQVEAKFCYVISGEVKLTKRDGSSIRVPLEDLSDKDREWIANRHKHTSSQKGAVVAGGDHSESPTTAGSDEPHPAAKKPGPP